LVHRLLRLAITLAVSVAMLAVPVISAAGAPPASTVSTTTVTLPGGDRTVELPAGDAVAVTARIDGREVEVRWHDGDHWSPWAGFAASGEHGPDVDSAEAARVDQATSEPVWIGRAERLELRSRTPGELHLELIEMDGGMGYDPRATPAATAEAFAVWPPIVPRAEWDPNGECVARGTHDVAPSVERIFVHHTVIFPHYAPEEGDDVVRAICLGHVNNRGFSDVGYNFLIDRFGVIYQGREGGILQPVAGAHAQGFNWGSVGIALVGDFQRGSVPRAAAQALDTLTTWLAEQHQIDPMGRGVHVSTGGTSTQYAEGDEVELPTILGHRDTALNSACPGDHLYDIVRGRNALAPRVRHRLTAHYGWPSIDDPRAAEVVPTTPRVDAPPSYDPPSQVTTLVSRALAGLQLPALLLR
jgi:hypothetical protein